MYDPLRAKTKVVFYVAVAFLFGLGIASGSGVDEFASNAMPVRWTMRDLSVPEEAVRPALDLSEAFTNLAEAVTPGGRADRNTPAGIRPGG